MIDKLSINQNWAKVCPWFAIISLIALITQFSPSDTMFWALINIPLYLLHQTEEHYIPGGFKKFMNENIFGVSEGEEKLTDIKIFWINIILVWLSFAVLGVLTFVNIGFGLCIIIFSVINCLTHILQGIRLKCWNPGLVMASIQFLISIYAAYFISVNGLNNNIYWWIGSLLFSIVVHTVLIKKIMPH